MINLYLFSSFLSLFMLNLVCAFEIVKGKIIKKEHYIVSNFLCLVPFVQQIIIYQSILHPLRTKDANNKQ